MATTDVVDHRHHELNVMSCVLSRIELPLPFVVSNLQSLRKSENEPLGLGQGFHLALLRKDLADTTSAMEGNQEGLG